MCVLWWGVGGSGVAGVGGVLGRGGGGWSEVGGNGGGRGSPTLFPGGIFQGVPTKLNFFDEISSSGKNCGFNEGPKI